MGEFIVQAISQLQRLHAARGLAAVAVVYHHLGLEAPEALRGYFIGSGILWVGVDVFFVLSGFLMMWTSYHRPGSPQSAVSFLASRLARIYPMYWVALAGTVILALTTVSPLSTTPTCSSGCDIFLIPESLPFLIGPAWTLSFEILFYLVFGGLMLLKPGTRINALVMWSLLVVFAGSYLSTRTSVTAVHHLLTPLILEFLIGAAIAVALKRGVTITPRLTAPMVVALLAGAVFFNQAIGALESGAAEWVRVILCGFPAAALIGAIVSWDSRAPVAAHPLLGWLGDRSYALYLIHWPIIMVTSAWLSANDAVGIPSVLVYSLVSLALSVALTEACTRFVGNPAQAMAKRALGAWPFRAAPT